MKVQNKVFVVTGAGGGIGGALVLELLSRGARVAAVDLKPDGLETLKDRAKDYANSLSTHPLDITNKEAVYQLPAAVIATHGSVDGLINCAGIVQPFIRINDLDYPEIEKVMNINFYGTLYMTKAFLPNLLDNNEAHIVNISSMGGFLPVPGQSIYGASKAAVKLMTEGLRAELIDTNVRVTVVFPGATSTNITQNSGVDAPRASAQDIKKISRLMLSPEKVAKIIVNGIEKNKAQIFTGKDSKLMNGLYRLRPIFATHFIAKRMSSILN